MLSFVNEAQRIMSLICIENRHVCAKKMMTVALNTRDFTGKQSVGG